MSHWRASPRPSIVSVRGKKRGVEWEEGVNGVMRRQWGGRQRRWSPPHQPRLLPAASNSSCPRFSASAASGKFHCEDGEGSPEGRKEDKLK